MTEKAAKFENNTGERHTAENAECAEAECAEAECAEAECAEKEKPKAKIGISNDQFSRGLRNRAPEGQSHRYSLT